MKYGFFIDHQVCFGNEVPATLINPATETEFAEVASASLQNLDDAVKGAQKCFDQTWLDLAPGKRAEILFKIAAGIRQEAEKLALLETRNIGKPLADSRDEMALGARIFEYYAGAIGKFFGQTIPVARGGFDFVLRQPLGVVAAIVPWNFPFPIACWKVAPALASGNCVVLKPASLSPLTALELGRICAEAGLPAGALQIISGSGSKLGDALVRHPLVRKISFTGSTEVGVRISEIASKGLKRVSLELGGKSPNIIFADADLEKAATSSPMSVFANTGQDCCARSRIFVEEKIANEFLKEFLTATGKLVVGDPERETTQLGPMVSEQQRNSVESFFKTLDSSRHQIVLGADRPAGKGWFLNPTVILGCEPGDRLWREEIFGPAVCIRTFNNEEDLLREVNDSPYGLSGSIWTRDLSRALRMARRVESGVLSINSHSSVHVEAPFGGFKMSGIGRDLGMTAMEGYTEVKNVYIGE
jgi:acyl-CoA reductase-like NAD-dependent aldehyde dehydrogenase